MDILKDAICFRGDFNRALKILENYSLKDQEVLITDLVAETEDVSVYNFVLFLIKNAVNKDALVHYHLLASGILTVQLPYLPYSYKRGCEHIKIALELDKNNPKVLDFFLFVYRDPNAKEFISRSEAIDVAKLLLKINPTHEFALSLCI